MEPLSSPQAVADFESRRDRARTTPVDYTPAKGAGEDWTGALTSPVSGDVPGEDREAKAYTNQRSSTEPS